MRGFGQRARRFSAQAVQIDPAQVNVHADVAVERARNFPVKLHHVRISEGSRTPLVALHGLFGSWRNVAPILHDFTEDRSVYCADLRNHGESPRVADMSLDTQVKDVKMILDRHNIERAILLGHGIGGRIACALALAHPERVAGVVSIEGVPGSFVNHKIKSELDHLFERLVQIPVIEVTSRMEADREMRELLIGLTDETRALVLASYMPDVAGRPGSWSWQFHLHAIKKQIDKLVEWPFTRSSYDGPALFCVQDIWNDIDFETTQRQFPSWQRERFQGADNGTIVPDLALTYGRLEFPWVLEDFLKTSRGTPRD